MAKSYLGEKKFYRLPHKGKIAGICAGLADSFEVNANFLRLIAVALVLSGIIPVVFVYITLIFVLPKKNTPWLPQRANQNQIIDISTSSKEIAPRSTHQIKWDLDRASKRLNRLESYLVSDRYQLDHQYKKLEMD